MKFEEKVENAMTKTRHRVRHTRPGYGVLELWEKGEWIVNYPESPLTLLENVMVDIGPLVKTHEEASFVYYEEA